MHDLDTVDIACGQFVHRHHILRVMVFDFKQVGNLTIGIFRQIAAYLHIESFIPSHRNKVNFFGCVFSDDSANPFSEKVVRSTAGALIPAYVERVKLSEAISSLKAEGFAVVSSELDETARKLSDFPSDVEKIALIVGNEGQGVSPAVSAAADEKLYIPIKNTNSLNAAVAAAIMMHYFSEV